MENHPKWFTYVKMSNDDEYAFRINTKINRILCLYRCINRMGPEGYDSEQN